METRRVTGLSSPVEGEARFAFRPLPLLALLSTNKHSIPRSLNIRNGEHASGLLE